MDLVRNYVELSKKWSDDFIVSMFPDMAEVVESKKSSNKKRKRSSSLSSSTSSSDESD